MWHDCGHVLGDDSIRPGGRYGWRASGVLNHTVTQAEPTVTVNIPQPIVSVALADPEVRVGETQPGSAAAIVAVAVVVSATGITGAGVGASCAANGAAPASRLISKRMASGLNMTSLLAATARAR